MQNRFIELTSIRHDENIIINVNHISMILPMRIGCQVLINGNEERPIPVVETFEDLKKLLVI